MRAFASRNRAPLIGAAAIIAASAVTAGLLWIFPQAPAAQTATVAAAETPDLQSAESWLAANASPDQQLIVDASMTEALAGSGWSADDLIGFSDAAAGDGASGISWDEVDFIVVPGAATAPDAGTPAAQAIDNSVVVASFADGDATTEIRRVVPDGRSVLASALVDAAVTRARFGAELAENPEVILSDADRSAVAEGRVDERIVAVLGTLASAGGVTVAAFPVVDGEDGLTLRQVAFTDVGGRDLVVDGAETEAAGAFVDALGAAYGPTDTSVEGERFVLRYSLTIDAALD